MGFGIGLARTRQGLSGSQGANCDNYATKGRRRSFAFLVENSASSFIANWTVNADRSRRDIWMNVVIEVDPIVLILMPGAAFCEKRVAYTSLVSKPEFGVGFSIVEVLEQPPLQIFVGATNVAPRRIQSVVTNENICTNPIRFDHTIDCVAIENERTRPCLLGHFVSPFICCG